MVSSSSRRTVVIDSLKRFLKQYVFDGVDINWEYPVAEDRAGNQADYETYVMFLKVLRAELGTEYGVTATLPVSYSYLQHLDVKNLAQHLDWINMQRKCDSEAIVAESVVQAHSNLTEIDRGLDLLWRTGIDPQKVVLGLGFYGSAFTLESPKCSKPGCGSAGSAKEGECTVQPGILSNSEIQDIIADNGITPILVKEDAVKYLTWDFNQWASYDDEETLKMKREYANSLCLGGTMVWALDLDKPNKQTSANNLLGSELSLNSKWNTLSSKRAITRSNPLALGLFWTACQPPSGGLGERMCPEGYRPIAMGHGKVFDADLNHLTGEGCHGGGVNGYQRALCAAANVQYGSLQWGPGSRSKACNSKCPRGWVTLTKNSHISGQKSGCKSRKYAPLCAYDMLKQETFGTCYSTFDSHILSGGYSQQIDLEEQFGFNLVGGPRPPLRRRSKQGARRSILGSSDCGGSLPIGDLSINVPARFRLETPGELFTYRAMEPTRSAIRKTNEPSTTQDRSTTTRHTTVTHYNTVYKTCDGARYPQPCFHYRPVIEGDRKYALNTCPNLDIKNNLRPLVALWNMQHTNSEWRDYIAQSYTAPGGIRRPLRQPGRDGCEKDEWPPQQFQQGVSDGYIRYLPGHQNGGVANHGESG
ncbi:hypothetical protein KC315_g2679 [Hortaea werneckii]|nr:hypothetical protein KC315_g2679 [Hortaea werneckii]